MSDELKIRLTELLEGPLNEAGANLVEMQLSRYKNNATLRLFVYTANGATLQECARLSKLVGGIVDGTDYLQSGYTLEVSSPGLDRPLKTLKDFSYRVGESVRIDFVDRSRKRVEAEIVAAAEGEVRFRNSDGEFAVPLSEIEQGKIIF